MSPVHATNSGPSESTSASLLQRVRTHDPTAWRRLADLYSPLVYSWARRGGLRDGDAADVVQDVFRAVFQGLDRFPRDGADASFRGWLWAITRNQVRWHFRRQGDAPQAVGGSEAAQRLAQHPDGPADPSEPDPDQTRRRIVQRALQLVQGDFSPNVWQAFVRTTLENHSAADVARDLGMTAGNVRQAKFRVLRRLREELEGQI